jgi:hypothetical protein
MGSNRVRPTNEILPCFTESRQRSGNFETLDLGIASCESAVVPSHLTIAPFTINIATSNSCGGPVAQLGEHLVCNQGVGSSNLPRSTIQLELTTAAVNWPDIAHEHYSCPWNSGFSQKVRH